MVLVLLSFFLSLFVNCVNTNLLVIFLEGSQILTSLGELSLLHTLSNVPVDKGTLGVHQIELVIETGPCLSDGSGVGQHAYGTLNLGKVTSGDNSGWLVVDADLEASGTPVNELDGTLCLDGGNGSIDVLGHHIATVKHAASHVLAVTRIALHHLVGGLKAGIGDLGNAQLLVVGLLSRDYRGVCHQGEVNTRVWNQVGLELGKINVESTVETKRSSDGGHDLSHQTVEVGVRWPLNIQVPTADIVNSLVVDHEGCVRVLQCSVSGEDRVVWLNHSSGYLWGGVDRKLKLGFLSIVDGKTLHEKGSEARASASTKGVEDQESLETSALIGKLTDPIKDKVNDLLSDGVVTTSIVVGSILLASDKLLRVEQLAVGARTNLICGKKQETQIPVRMRN